MRVGRFRISRLLIERDEATVRAILGRCHEIVSCDESLEADGFVYVAVGPDFDEIAKGQCAPPYAVHISENGKKIEFKRDT